MKMRVCNAFVKDLYAVFGIIRNVNYQSTDMHICVTLHVKHLNKHLNYHSSLVIYFNALHTFTYHTILSFSLSLTPHSITNYTNNPHKKKCVHALI